MEEEKNMIKGQEGEAFVIREVGKVANYLGKTIRCFNHVILDFDSVYGSRTAELDHIIICGDKILKVIIETCLLTEEEKIKMCEIVTEAGADFIKTSTGFSTSGATFDDIALFKKHVGENVKIKAAGGISSFVDAEKFIELGADRLGTSRLVKIAKAED